MRVYRDPLVHFLALGVLLFFSYYWLNPEQGDSIIEVSDETIARLEQKWEILWNRNPTEKELQGLVEAYTREEILSREALAMGLDRDDPVIRRRLAQKVDFLLDEMSDLENPNDDELMEFYLNNPDHFSIGPFLSFYHIYLNPEKYSEPAAMGSKLLQTLRTGAVVPEHAGDYGDPFFNGAGFHHRSKSQINRIFGKGFAESLIGLRLNEWSGPVQSGLGTHLIFLSHVEPLSLPEFESIRTTVTQHYLNERRRLAKDNAYKELKRRYRVRVIGTEQI